MTLHKLESNGRPTKSHAITVLQFHQAVEDVIPTTPEQKTSNNRDPKVRLQRQQMWFNSRKDSAEIRSLRCKVGKCPAPDNPVRVITEQVVPPWIEFRRLDEGHREKVLEVDPHSTATHPTRGPPTPTGRLLDRDVVDHPGCVTYRYRCKSRGEGVDEDEGANNRGENAQKDVCEYRKGLEATFDRDGQDWRKFHTQHHDGVVQR